MIPRVTVLETCMLTHAVWDGTLLAVSDLHQNSHGAHDNFQKVLFYMFLRNVIKTMCGKLTLLIVGDRHERLEEPRGAAIARNNLSVDRLINSVPVIDLPGNHDDVEGAVNEMYKLQRDGIFAWHGHQLDPACSGNRRLDRAGSAIWGLLERLRLGGVLRGVKEKVVRAYRSRIKTASKRNEGNAAYRRDAVERDTLLYICGHTHLPELFQWEPGKVFANCGCWTRSGKGYAVIVEGRKVTLVEVT